MKGRQRYSKAFKMNLLEELQSGTISVSALCRKYGVSRQAIYLWEKEYLDGKVIDVPETKTGYEHRIAQLERKVGQLLMDNDLLKKALQSANNHRRSDGKSSEIISPLTRPSKGDVK